MATVVKVTLNGLRIYWIPPLLEVGRDAWLRSHT